MPPPRPDEDENEVITGRLQDVMSGIPQGIDKVQVSSKLIETFRKLGPFNIEKLIEKKKFTLAKHKSKKKAKELGYNLLPVCKNILGYTDDHKNFIYSG